MTRKRNDLHSTELGLWLREQKELDSKLGFVATNLDYIWKNYFTGLWLLLEEKRYNSKMTFSQKEMFRDLDAEARKNNKYCGFHLLVFEKTSPKDGIIRLNGSIITTEQLIKFLRFETIVKGYFETKIKSKDRR